MSANGAHKQRSNVSVLTLVIAAVASGAAAIVTSYLWKGGTIMAAAFTPVIVALVKEGLQRPIESDVVRRPVRRFQSSRTSEESREHAYAHTGAPSRFEPPPPPEPFASGPGDMSPVRTYGTSSRRRRWHLKAAIVTGVIGFAIAAIVLTVPELVFGGSVAGHGSTTFFSTHKSRSSTKQQSDQQKTTTDQTQTDTNQQTTTTPPSQQSQQGTQTSTQPQQQAPPSQQSQPGGGAAPQQTPAPSTPASPTP